MNPETKKIVTALGLISFTVVMLGIALNFGSVCRGITRLIDVFMPFIIGIGFALFLSVPMNFMERKVLAGKQFDKMRRTLAILITLVLVFGIIGAVGALIVPQLTKTVSSIVQAVPGAMQNLDNYQQELSGRFPQFADTITKVNLSSERVINEVIGFLNNWMNNPDSSAMAKLSGTLGNMLNLFIGLIFAIYVLDPKEKLKSQQKNLWTRGC